MLPQSARATEIAAPDAVTEPAEEAHQAMWRDRQANADSSASNDRLNYYNCDHLGTPRELVDEVGRVVWAARTLVWGGTRTGQNSAGADGIVSETTQPLRFQGQYDDIETGLFYNRYRYYDPDNARYITADPIKLLGGWNAYRYAPNPIGWVDPIGLAAVWNCASNRWTDSDTGRFRSRPTEAVKTNPNEAYFWSGRTEGMGGEHIAKQIATANGGTTLELQLEKSGVVMPPWDPNNKAATKEWEEISKSYAGQACGTAKGVIGKELRPGNIWEGREVNALLGNSQISKIDIIDPKYRTVKNIFRRK